MRHQWIYILMVMLACCFSSQALAGDFDGSKPLICAIIEVVECAPGSECSRSIPENFNLPQFVKINFKDRTITSKRPDGEEKVTLIEHIKRLNGELFLYGVEQGLGWIAVISETTGKVTVTLSDNQVAFNIFGACIPKD